MPNLGSSEPARTLLQRLIGERNYTFEEFAEFAASFAHEHGELGTISARHTQRLAAGKGEQGKPLGRPLPATARLLERIFGVGIDKLLAPPSDDKGAGDVETELRQMLRASAQVDDDVLRLLQGQLTATRRLDRQLGAAVARDEVLTKIGQVEKLLRYSLSPDVRERLAGLLSELCTLAGWQALDSGGTVDSWRQYTLGRSSGAECTDPAYQAHAAAGQAFVLIDLGDSDQACQLLSETRRHVKRRASPLMRSWLAAAHGEALAADGARDDSLRAFDRARTLLPANPADEDGPYVVLDPVHLTRWRGHALARVGESDAIDVLSRALDELDSTFVRAEAGLRVDLATAYLAAGERDAVREHAKRAESLANEIGSMRQRRRIARLTSA